MKKEEVQKLRHGLYAAYWKESSGGGSSFAAIGSDRSGNRWIAPTNWVSGSTTRPSIWRTIERVELIVESKY